jgi:hypothetical protein
MPNSTDRTDTIPEMNPKTAFPDPTDDTMDQADRLQARNRRSPAPTEKYIFYTMRETNSISEAIIDAMLGRTRARPPPPAPYPGVHIWYERFNTKVVNEAINQTATEAELKELESKTQSKAKNEEYKCSKVETTTDVNLENPPVIADDTLPENRKRTRRGTTHSWDGCELDHLAELAAILDIEDGEIPDTMNAESSIGLKDGLLFDSDNRNDTNKY